jgi:hypothetical protein
MSATDEDINDVEAWAGLIEDMLWRVPAELRENVLNLATERARGTEERAAKNGRLWQSPADLEDWLKSPAVRSRGAKMRLKALLIQIFARDITNNHHPDDAAKLLFAHQRFGTGGCELLDYIDDLPRPEA